MFCAFSAHMLVGSRTLQHGGAWGSGLPWFYRLVSLPFLEMNLAVAVVGYRTYPDADVNGQVDDLERAAAELARRFPDLCKRLQEDGEYSSHTGVCLMGHSSGAHIAFLMLVERARIRVGKALALANSGGVNSSTLESTKALGLVFDSFVGISGPYGISHHFDYEAGRGVEEISPMKPACGSSREEFDRNSPAHRVRQLFTNVAECDMLCSDNFIPRMLLIHGIEDGTVPFTATAEAARTLRSCGASKCTEVYLAQTGHQDTVMHLMLGGRARDVIVHWLSMPEKDSSHKRSQADMIAKSKL